MKLSKRVQQLTPSTTLAITAKAKALRKQGHDVIGLGAGEPDFNTPEPILRAAEEAMRAGHTKYTPSGGIPELKQAIVGEVPEGQRTDLSARSDCRDFGGQARPVQSVPSADRSGRRGDHSRPLLGKLYRAGEIGRRNPGHHPGRRIPVLQGYPGAAFWRDYGGAPELFSSTVRPTPPGWSTAAKNWRLWAVFAWSTDW